MKLCDTAKRIGSFLICVHIVFCSIAFFVMASEDVPLDESISAASDSLPDNLPPVASPGSLSESLPASIPECKTAAQLKTLVAESNGDPIILTGDIEVSGRLDLSANAHTTVIMGPHRIIVSRNSALIIYSPLSFKGNGTSAPLFKVASGGSLVMFDKVSITSTGTESTAIYLDDGAAIENDVQISVSAEGDGSTAILADGDLYLASAVIKAVGQGSVGVHAVGDVDTFCSDISGDLAAILSDNGEITLDVSVVSHVPEKANIIERKAVYEPARYGIWIEPGDTPYLDDYLCFPLYNIKDIEDIKDLILPVAWEVPPYNQNTPGEHKLHFTPLEQPINGIKGLEHTAIMLHIADPSTPSLFTAEWYKNTVTIFFFREIQEAASLKLWYSLDEEEPLADAVADLGATVTDTKAVIPNLDIDAVYRFQLEVTGGPMAGESNVIKTWYNPLKDDGGDRGGDWDDDAPLPQVTQPPPNPPSTEPPTSQPSADPPTDPPPTEPPSGTASGGGTRRSGDGNKDSDQAAQVFAPEAETPPVAEQALDETQTPHADSAAKNTHKPETDDSPPRTVNSSTEQQNNAPLPGPVVPTPVQSSTSTSEPVAASPKQPPAPLPEPVPAESGRTWALVTGSVAACGAGGFAASHFLLRGRP